MFIQDSGEFAHKKLFIWVTHKEGDNLDSGHGSKQSFEDHFLGEQYLWKKRSQNLYTLKEINARFLQEKMMFLDEDGFGMRFRFGVFLGNF